MATLEVLLIVIILFQCCPPLLHADGYLYSWGDNSDQQLGHNRDKSHVSTPTLISGLVGLPVVKLTAGKAHNLVLSVGGGVIAWGRNT